MWVAKPNLVNENGVEKFKTMEDAVKYLSKYTGVEMSFEWIVENRKKRKLYDWEILGKLYEVEDPYRPG